MLTVMCILSALFMMATIGDINQLRGNLFGTVLWMLAAVPGGMWLMAVFFGSALSDEGAMLKNIPGEIGVVSHAKLPPSSIPSPI